MIGGRERRVVRSDRQSLGDLTGVLRAAGVGCLCEKRSMPENIESWE